MLKPYPTPEEKTEGKTEIKPEELKVDATNYDEDEIKKQLDFTHEVPEEGEPVRMPTATKNFRSNIDINGWSRESDLLSSKASP